MAAANRVYRQIGVRVVERGPAAWDSRTSTSKGDKIVLALQGLLMAVRAKTLDRWREPPVRPPLWSRL